MLIYQNIRNNLQHADAWLMIAKNYHIAIVDDDRTGMDALSALLEQNGFQVTCFDSGKDLNNADLSSIELFIIDLRLGCENGLDVAQKIHWKFGKPIIMFSGAADDVDKIVGLESAADDYLMKPFNPRELVARVRALLRRTHPGNSAYVQARDKSSAVQFGKLILDFEKRCLFDLNGKEMSLTNAEFRMLEYFVRNHDRVISRVELLDHIGSNLSHYVDRTIDVLILRLRRKVERVPSKPMHLQTRRGLGYIFILHPEGGGE